MEAFTADHYSDRLYGGNINDCFDSSDIDRLFAKCTDLSVLPAEFARMSRDHPRIAKNMLRDVRSYPIIIPFNCEFHWIAIVLFEEDLYVANSATLDCHRPHLERFFHFLADCGECFKVQHLTVPQQPHDSTECGVH